MDTTGGPTVMGTLRLPLVAGRYLYINWYSVTEVVERYLTTDMAISLTIESPNYVRRLSLRTDVTDRRRLEPPASTQASIGPNPNSVGSPPYNLTLEERDIIEDWDLLEWRRTLRRHGTKQL
jgi:hypothetical protein